MRYVMLTVACLLLVAVLFAMNVGSVAAEGWCPKC